MPTGDRCNLKFAPKGLPDDTGLGRDKSDRAVPTPLHQSEPTSSSQRGITVGHEAGLLARMSWSLPILREGPASLLNPHRHQPYDRNI